MFVVASKKKAVENRRFLSPSTGDCSPAGLLPRVAIRPVAPANKLTWSSLPSLKFASGQSSNAEDLHADRL